MTNNKTNESIITNKTKKKYYKIPWIDIFSVFMFVIIIFFFITFVLFLKSDVSQQLKFQQGMGAGGHKLP